MMSHQALQICELMTEAKEFLLVANEDYLHIHQSTALAALSVNTP